MPSHPGHSADNILSCSITCHVHGPHAVFDACDRIPARLHDQHTAARHVDAEGAIAVPANEWHKQCSFPNILSCADMSLSSELKHRVSIRDGNSSCNDLQ